MNKCLRVHPYSRNDELPLCKGYCNCILLPDEEECECCIQEKQKQNSHTVSHGLDTK